MFTIGEGDNGTRPVATASQNLLCRMSKRTKRHTAYVFPLWAESSHWFANTLARLLREYKNGEDIGNPTEVVNTRRRRGLASKRLLLKESRASDEFLSLG